MNKIKIMETTIQHQEQDYCFYCGKPLEKSGIYCNQDCADNDGDMSDEEDSDEDYEDEFEDAMDNCGQMSDGLCSMIGSEYCDWECPFRNEMFDTINPKSGNG